MSTIDRRVMVRWLLRHGFLPAVPITAANILVYKKNGVRIQIPGQGPEKLSRDDVNLVLRKLEGLGYSRREVRKELTGT